MADVEVDVVTDEELDLPVDGWTQPSDDEYERGFELDPAQLPKVFAFHRNPAMMDDTVPGPSGPVAWGMELPDGHTILLLPERGGRRETVTSDSAERLRWRWSGILDAQLCWLPTPTDTTLQHDELL